MVVRAADVASYQGVGDQFRNLMLAHSIQHCIIHTYHGYEASYLFDSYTAQQAAICDAIGITRDPYGWAFNAYPPERTVDEIVERWNRLGKPIHILWFDCEIYNSGGFFDPGPNADWLSRAIDRAEKAYGLQTGIYTGFWWVRDYFPGGFAEFANFGRIPLGLAVFDENPDINVIPAIPPGFSRVAFKQWSDTNKALDRDTFLDEFAGTVPAPQPPSDDLATCKSQVEMLRILADDVANERLLADIKDVELVLEHSKASVTELEAVLSNLKATRIEGIRIREQALGRR